MTSFYVWTVNGNAALLDLMFNGNCMACSEQVIFIFMSQTRLVFLFISGTCVP